MNQYEGKPHNEILKSIYEQSLEIVSNNSIDSLISQIDENDKNSLQIFVENCESSKGVLTVLITSLVHKLHNPNQDIRMHQDNMQGGYSGRGIDTKYITPFMKEHRFPSMSESGWLTRSLEQNLPYDKQYPGKIKPEKLKKAFLHLLDEVVSQNKSPDVYLLYLFVRLIQHRDQKHIDLAKPFNLSISKIVSILREHFENKYPCRGASRLVTLAIYSVYQCMVGELKRFEKKKLMPLEEHTSSDRSSGRVGDIEIRDENDIVFEAVEVKHGISINSQHIKDAYEKFKSYPIQRYYLLSSSDVSQSEIESIKNEVSRVANIHGCQVIVNGVYPSLAYYLRLLSNTSDFIQYYVENFKKDSAIKYEHREKWNEIVSM